MYVLLLSQDLLVTSRVSGVVQALNVSFKSVSSTDNLQLAWSESPAELIVVDLTLPGLDVEEVVQWIHAQQTRATVIAFGPHVQLKTLERAEQSGCDHVYVRGEFFAQMQNILLRAFAHHTTSKDGEH